MITLTVATSSTCPVSVHGLKENVAFIMKHVLKYVSKSNGTQKVVFTTATANSKSIGALKGLIIVGCQVRRGVDTEDRLALQGILNDALAKIYPGIALNLVLTFEVTQGRERIYRSQLDKTSDDGLFASIIANLRINRAVDELIENKSIAFFTQLEIEEQDRVREIIEGRQVSDEIRSLVPPKKLELVK
jgi:hypothetical protein